MNVGIKHSSGRWVLPLTVAGVHWRRVGGAELRPRRWYCLRRMAEGADARDAPRHGKLGALRRGQRVVPSQSSLRRRGGAFRRPGKDLPAARIPDWRSHGHLMEPQVVELSDGSIVMLLRSRGVGVLLRSISRDGRRELEPTGTNLHPKSLEQGQHPAPIRWPDLPSQQSLVRSLQPDEHESAPFALGERGRHGDMEPQDRPGHQAGRLPARAELPERLPRRGGDAIRFLWEDSHTVFFMGIDLARLDEPDGEAFVPLETVRFSFGRDSRKAELITAVNHAG